MKITIERAALLRALNHVQSVVERRNTIPILANVLVEARDGMLSLNATDMDISIVEKTAAEVATPGSITAPAHTLYDIVRKLPDGAQVELGKEEDRLELRSGRSRFTLQTLPTEDFPVMTGGDMPHTFNLSADALRGIVDRTRFAISNEETRYYLNGIYLHVAEAGNAKVLRAAATDGHRLARYEIEAPEGADAMPGVILPRKAVGEIRKLAEEMEEAIEIGVSDGKIRLEFGPVVLTSKLIDGTFPDYERVIPADNDKPLQVVTGEFAEAVDRVATISTDKARAVKLNLGDDKLILSVTNPESGSATEELSVDFQAEPLEIGFNARYLIDIMGQLGGEKAQFLLKDAGSPTLVRDASDESALYVLMPMRI